MEIDQKTRKTVLRQFRSGGVDAVDLGEGVKIIIQHYRYDKVTNELKRYKRNGPKDEDGNRWKPEFSPTTHGGQTVCVIVDGGEQIAHGIAVCHGLKTHEEPVDQYNYKIGAHIAFGRALDKLVS